MKKPVAGAIVIAIFSAFAGHVAAAGVFDGPYVHGGLNLARNSADMKSGNSAIPSGSSSAASNVNAALGLGYVKSFGKYSLGLNFWYVAGDQKAGNYDFVDTGGVPGSVEHKVKEMWGMSIEPGVYLDKESLLYARITPRAGIKKSFQYSEPYTSPDDSFVGGTAVGMGYKRRLNANLYGYAEIDQAKFTVTGESDDKDSSVSSLTARAGFGYQF